MKQNLFNHVAGSLEVFSKIINYLSFIIMGMAMATFFPEKVTYLAEQGEDFSLFFIFTLMAISLLLDGLAWLITRKYIKPMEATQ